jgi:hypothetical protein
MNMKKLMAVCAITFGLAAGMNVHAQTKPAPVKSATTTSAKSAPVKTAPVMKSSENVGTKGTKKQHRHHRKMQHKAATTPAK